MDQPPTVHLLWRLHTSAPVAATWAALSDTDRLNRLAGFGMRFEQQPQPDGTVRRAGRMRHFGLVLTWREQPVRYDAPHGFLIDRLFDSGPVFRSTAALRLEAAADGGTDIAYDIALFPRRPLLKPVVELDARVSVRPRFDRALRLTLDALDRGQPPPDLAPPPLPAAAQALLERGLQHVGPPAVADGLHALLCDGPLPQQDRIRPLELARRWRQPGDAVVRGCLQAVRAGVLTLRWELLCPSCRLPGARLEQLPVGPTQVHCASCNIAYDGSFADSVEAVFRPSPTLRRVDVPVECLSSPARAPHVVAQGFVGADAEAVWDVPLLPGAYRLRTLPPLESASLVVGPEHAARELTVVAGRTDLQPALLRVAPGLVRIRLRARQPVQVLLERRWQPPHALTAGHLLQVPGVLDLLPAGALQPDVAVEAGHAAVLVVQVLRGGQPALEAVRELLRASGPHALQIADGTAIAVFDQLQAALAPASRVQGALFLAAGLCQGLVVHLRQGEIQQPSGPAVQAALQLAQAAEPGELCLGDADGHGAHLLSSEAGERVRLDPRPDTPAGPAWRLAFARREDPVLPLPTLNRDPVGPGDVLDQRFELDAPLGKGGFGAVFLARDRHTRGEVVVKVLHPRFAGDPEQVQRFYNEGRLAARLRGPHTVRVHEFGHTDDGRLYLAMERLHGCELAEVLQAEQTLEPRRASRLMLETLAGLAEAHAQGLVHRDVKPGNLFLCQDGAGGEVVKVIDFGIALDTTGATPTVDEEGGAVGTPQYMSPEQVRGEPLDGRSDLYAVTLVLYQCLAGTLPFRGESAVGIMIGRLTELPLPLAEVTPQALPPGLDALVMRNLAVERTERCADATTLATGLRQVLERAGDPACWQAPAPRPDSRDLPASADRDTVATPMTLDDDTVVSPTRP